MLPIYKHDQQTALQVFLTVLALFLVLLQVLKALVAGDPGLYHNLFYWPLSQLLAALLLVPLVTGSFNRLEQKPLSRRIFVYVLSGLVYSMLLFILSGFFILLLERLFSLPEHFTSASLLTHFRTQWTGGLYFFFLFVSQNILLQLQKMATQLLSLRLSNATFEREKKAGDLATLRYRLSPHFLFNSLNNVVMVIRKGDNETAVDSLIGLKEILSSTMNKEKKQFVSLREEMELLRHFVELERLRKESLEIEIQIDGQLLDYRLPALITQPIVENAFKFAKEMQTPRVLITASAKNDRLILKVYNSGNRFSGWTLAGSHGIGLTNTLHRLRHCYGTDFSFTSKDQAEGVEVTIDIPALKLLQ